MMRRYFVLLLAFIFLSGSAYAEAQDVDLSDMSVDELLLLRDHIDQMLIQKGYAVYTDITHGDKGEHVVKLQEYLTRFGYYQGKISGKYDSVTEKAVKQFQKNNGFEVTGTATQELQAYLYVLDPSAIVTATPKPTVAPTPTIDPIYSAYSPIDYDEYSRYPEQFKGMQAELAGKVLQVIGSKDIGFSIRLATSGSSDVVYIMIKKGIVDFNILEDDRLTVYAVMNGVYTYTSTLGVPITIPYAVADMVVLR